MVEEKEKRDEENNMPDESEDEKKLDSENKMPEETKEESGETKEEKTKETVSSSKKDKKKDADKPKEKPEKKKHDLNKFKHSVKRKVQDSKLNPWAVATVILAVISVILLAMVIRVDATQATGSGITPVGDQAAEEVVIDFAEAQGLEANIDGVGIENALYRVNITVQGQEVPVYLTLDGESIVPSVLPVDDLLKQIEASNQAGQEGEQTNEQTPQNIPKSDKPEVELFVMSLCPYGTQAEKGMLPVVNELKDKIDFKLRFVNYAMHPTQGEVEEQLNQHCIQEEQNDKFNEYLACYLEDGDGERCIESIGIDTDTLEECTQRVDEEYDIIANLEDKSSWLSGRYPKFLIHDEKNKEYGVRGSPALVINGEQVSSNGRNAEAYLDVVCEAFNDKPEECDTDMSSFGDPSPGLGYGGQGGSATNAGCAA